MRDRANPENTSGATDSANLFEPVGKQCGLAVRATHALTAYLESGDKEAVGHEHVRQLS